MGAIQKPSEYVYRHKSLGKNRNERFGVYFLFFGRYRETLQYKKEQRKKKRKKGYPQLISRVSFSIPSRPSRLVSRPVLFPVPPRFPSCSVLRPSRSPPVPFSARPVFRPSRSPPVPFSVPLRFPPVPFSDLFRFPSRSVLRPFRSPSRFPSRPDFSRTPPIFVCRRSRAGYIFV